MQGAIRWMALLTVVVLTVCQGAEVVLDLPDPLTADVQMSGELRVTDAPSTITNIIFPSIPGMTIDVPDEGGSQQEVIVNGKRTSTRGIPLLVTARVLGSTVIPPITLRLQDGSKIQTKPITVNVERGNPKLTGEAYGDVRFEPDTIVPGEPTKLIYRIYLVRGQVDKPGIEPPPGSISLGERDVKRGRCFDKDGRQWGVFTLTWPMTMSTPGTYQVSGQQSYQVVVGDGFFDNRVLRSQVAVAPATLTVKSLPVEGRPDDFTGLIGPLTLTAELDRSRISAGEGVELRVVAAGRQVDLLKLPTLAMPTGVQSYPKDDGKAPDAHTRIFRFDLVPSVTGDVVLPSVSIPYFDPEAKVYRRAESRPVTLTIVPGRARDLTVTGATTTTVTPTTTAAPVVPEAHATLPPPLRGNSHQPPSPLVPLMVGGSSMLVGALLAVLRNVLGRRPAAHRGRALALALSRGDLTAAASTLASLRPSLTTAPQQAAAKALEEAVDRARFGGQSLPDPSLWLRELEKLP